LCLGRNPDVKEIKELLNKVKSSLNINVKKFVIDAVVRRNKEKLEYLKKRHSKKWRFM